MTRIAFDYSEAGISAQEAERFQPFVDAAHRKLHNGTMPYSGWVDYPNNITEDMLSGIEKAAARIKKDCTALVVIGIGGSYLGAKSCIELLQNRFTPPPVKVVFAGWNLSGTYHAELINSLKDEELCVCVVSKSGTTMETSSAFKLFKLLLRQRYSDDFAGRIYAVTDEKTGELRAECRKNGYTSFVLEGNIGGRYSVLTAAGLLPIAAAGINIRKIVEGAGWAQDELTESDLRENDAYRYAVVRRIFNNRGMKAELFAYNEPRLEYFAEWLKQLFGESEGKEGKGMLPLSAMFTRDLHSLGQYMQQGTHFFGESLIKVNNPVCDVSFGAGRLSYNDMNDIVFRAAGSAHASGGTPIITFTLEDMSEETYGYCVYFFEKACAVSCMLLGVDPFDQPGVEIYKNNVREMMAEK